MSQRHNQIRNIREIKAIRGEKLIIDLGKAFDGTLTSWIKKEPNSESYREFEILDNRYLILPKEKTQDYYNNTTTPPTLIESIKGRWYFDVEQIPENGVEDDSKTIYTGTIYFENDITNSGGIEINGNPLERSFIALSDTPLSYEGAGKIVAVNSTNDGLEFIDNESGSSSFLELTDVSPNSFSGQAGKYVFVNQAEDALEFRFIEATEIVSQNGNVQTDLNNIFLNLTNIYSEIRDVNDAISQIQSEMVSNDADLVLDDSNYGDSNIGSGDSQLSLNIYMSERLQEIIVPLQGDINPVGKVLSKITYTNNSNSTLNLTFEPNSFSYLGQTFYFRQLSENGIINILSTNGLTIQPNFSGDTSTIGLNDHAALQVIEIDNVNSTAVAIFL